jgi:hypothetical protein
MDGVKAVGETIVNSDATPKVSRPSPTMAVIGQIGTFDANDKTWDSYTERFENFCKCNKIPDDLRTSTLLTVVGAKTYNVNPIDRLPSHFKNC